MENEPQDAYLPDNDTETLHPFDVRAQSGRMGMVKFVGVVIFLLVLAYVVVKLFASGTRDRETTPNILADNTPYKEVPLDPGGIKTPNQDKEIFEVSNKPESPAQVKTVPIAEEPLPKPEPRPVANVFIKQPDAPDNQAANPQKADKPTSKPANDPNAEPANAEPANTRPALTFGDYVVQVASLRSQAQAEQAWSRLSATMGDVLTDAHFADIKRIDLGERGIYYRLRVNGLADKAAASRLCAQFKDRKQDCIVTKK